MEMEFKKMCQGVFSYLIRMDIKIAVIDKNHGIHCFRRQLNRRKELKTIKNKNLIEK